MLCILSFVIFTETALLYIHFYITAAIDLQKYYYVTVLLILLLAVTFNQLSDILEGDCG